MCQIQITRMCLVHRTPAHVGSTRNDTKSPLGHDKTEQADRHPDRAPANTCLTQDFWAFN